MFAQEYCRDGDLHVFNEFQTIIDCQDQDARRRTVCGALHNTFVNDRDDALIHCNVMKYLQ